MISPILNRVIINFIFTLGGYIVLSTEGVEMETVGQRLKRLRVEREYSLNHCARKIDVSPSTYAGWEEGRTIQGEPYVKLAMLLDVSLSYILTGQSNDLCEHLEQVQRSAEQLVAQIKYSKALL